MTNTLIPELAAQRTYSKDLEFAKINAQRFELTDAEKKRPFAKYYYEAMPEPDPQSMALMEKPCDPAKALLPEQLNDLLNPGYLDVETGWCILPSGGGFIANKTFYPGATAEMVDWWFAWHPLEDLRYRIWYPPQHGGIMVSPENRRRLLDESIPMAERNWGVTHHVIEDTNTGMGHVDIDFMSPRQFGFDMDRWHKPFVATFQGGQGWSSDIVKTERSITSPAIMCHFFREVDGGLEQRTRFWMGYRFSGGKPEITLPSGVRIPEAVVKGLARHNVAEFTRFKTFLPHIYKEFNGKMAV